MRIKPRRRSTGQDALRRDQQSGEVCRNLAVNGVVSVRDSTLDVICVTNAPDRRAVAAYIKRELTKLTEVIRKGGIKAE